MITTAICLVLLLFQTAFLLKIVTIYFPYREGSLATTIRNVSEAIVNPVLLPVRQFVPTVGGVFPVADLLVLILVGVLIQIVCRGAF